MSAARRGSRATAARGPCSARSRSRTKSTWLTSARHPRSDLACCRSRTPTTRWALTHSYTYARTHSLARLTYYLANVLPHDQVGVEHHRALLDMNAPIPSARHGVITSSLPMGADGSHLQQQQEQQLETSAVAIAACSQQAAGPRSSEQGRHSPGVTSGAARATGPQRKKCQLSPVATRPSAAKVVKVASAPSPAPGTDTSDSDLNV